MLFIGVQKYKNSRFFVGNSKKNGVTDKESDIFSCFNRNGYGVVGLKILIVMEFFVVSK